MPSHFPEAHLDFLNALANLQGHFPPNHSAIVLCELCLQAGCIKTQYGPRSRAPSRSRSDRPRQRKPPHGSSHYAATRPPPRAHSRQPPLSRRKPVVKAVHAAINASVCLPSPSNRTQPPIFHHQTILTSYSHDPPFPPPPNNPHAAPPPLLPQPRPAPLDHPARLVALEPRPAPRPRARAAAPVQGHGGG